MTAPRREVLAARIRHYFTASDGTYGYRRIHADLTAEGVEWSPELVRQIMRQENLVPCQPRPFRVTAETGAEAAAVSTPQPRAAPHIRAVSNLGCFVGRCRQGPSSKISSMRDLGGSTAGATSTKPDDDTPPIVVPKYAVPSDVAWIDGDAHGYENQLYLTRVPSGETVVLNGSARLIWLAAITSSDITSHIAEESGLPVDDIAGDVTTFTKELLAKRLLIKASATRSP